jgi:ribosomal protein S3AE
LNPSHPVIRAIEAARNSDDDGLKKAAKLAAEQVFDNARISAGAMDDPREMVGRIHELLELALPKPKD